MSDDNGGRVQVVGAVDDRPSRRPSGGLLILAGLVVGLAVSVLLIPSRASSDAVSEPLATTTTVNAAADETTTTTVAAVRVERYQERIGELESELAAAHYELGLETNPVGVAFVVDCEARQQVEAFVSDTFFVGSVGFWFSYQDPSGEDELFAEVWASVERGDSVTLVVPSSERDRYSLLWNPATWRGDNSVASGEPAVTLQACEGFPTVFVGGFAAELDYCAPLDVYFGDSTKRERVILPFGVAECPDGTTPLAKPEAGPVPDVVGSTLRDARLEIRLTDLIPDASDGDPIDPGGMVWGQEPNAGGTYESGTVIGLRTCQPADDVVATYQERLEGTGVTLSDAWMAPSLGNTLDSWYFVGALVSGGVSDGQIATWALPAFGPNAGVDSVNTPGLSFPANEVSQGFDFGNRSYSPDDFGVTDWLDIDGAVASQRCVSLSRAG